jgi:hypothetical protein
MCSAATRSARVRQRQAGVDQQAVAVLHQPMPDEVQLRLLASTQPGIDTGGRSMDVVRTFLAIKVRFGIAPLWTNFRARYPYPRSPSLASEGQQSKCSTVYGVVFAKTSAQPDAMMLG